MTTMRDDSVGNTRPGYPEHPFPSRLTETVKDNLERNRRELASGEVHLSSKPVVAWLAFTGRCNLSCSHCDRTPEMRGHGEDMTEDVFEKLYSQLFPFVERIWLGGNNTGEQLLARNLESMLDRMGEFPLIPEVITNGTPLSEKHIRQLVSLNATIAISLEGIRPETYEASRGRPIDKLLEHVAEIAEERSGRQGNKTRIHFGYTAYYDNIRELPELIRRAGDLGVDRIEVHHLFPIFEHQRYQSLVYHRALTNDIFAEAEQLAASSGVELRLPPRFELSSMNGGQPEAVDERLDCPLPWIGTSVTENGDVTPCCGGTSMVLGNLREQSFDEIWNGGPYQKLRRTVNSKNPLPLCANCPAVWRGLNHKDESILRIIGMGSAQQSPSVHLRAYAKSVLQSGKLGRRLLETYRRVRRSRSG
jgi:MoaA/NifB/PqqE/SkfB family radical SAM enzyme